MYLTINELMLNNLISSNDEYCTIDAFLRNGNISTNKGTGHISEFQPIPLTEEILLKCGFVKLKPQFSLSVGGESLIYYLHEESGFLIWYHGEKLGYSLQQVIRNSINPECTCFNTVHELQNIFYWNKKKQELEIKL